MELCVSHCLAWAPDITEPSQWREWSQGNRNALSQGQPTVAKVPSLLRRRLTRWGRLSLQVGCDLADQMTPETPVVFSSRHGDTTLTQQLLRDLANGDPLSPTAFSLSVHNAAVGLFSMVEKITAPTLALAAGRETLAYAFVEAAALLGEGAQQVLVLHADEPLAEFYASDADEIEMSAGVAVLLVASGGTKMRLTSEASAALDASPQQRSLATEFLAWWFGVAPHMHYKGDRLVWCWERG